MLDDDQLETIEYYKRDSTLSEKVIVIDSQNSIIIDGNHRALAAALLNKPINYIDVSEVDTELDEMAMTAYQPIGDFNKPGPFRAVDRRLVPHPTNQLKTAKFLENTPYDFRLFFSNIPGTGKYSESGPMDHTKITEIFKDSAAQIIEGSEDAINIVFVGNSGADKVMLTPWLMAHRFGHAIQAGARKNKGWHAWTEAEQQFFRSVNVMLDENYGKQIRSPSGYGTVPGYKAPSMVNSLTPEYNALFNAIGTQRSSRTNNIKRPYEFMYELFAQYLKDGRITLNPLPNDLGYGRRVFGNPSSYLRLKPESSDESSRQEATQMLANDMGYMFDDVLNSSVGQIFVM
jgi:hypothetical protein